MTVTDRTDATEQEFRARIAAFETAPTPPEVREAAVVEEVARAIHDEDCDCEERPCFDGSDRRYRRLAAAAVAAYRATQDGGAEEAVRRCGSRGPRIGSEGKPICRQPRGHAGPHRPAADDGWGDVTWNDFS